jgi:hypothetical protein
MDYGNLFIVIRAFRLKFVIGVVAKNVCCIKLTNNLMQRDKIIWSILSSIFDVGVNKICTKKKTTQKKSLMLERNGILDFMST